MNKIIENKISSAILHYRTYCLKCIEKICSLIHNKVSEKKNINLEEVKCSAET